MCGTRHLDIDIDIAARCLFRYVLLDLDHTPTCSCNSMNSINSSSDISDLGI